LARYLPDGNIEFLGRIDNQVKVSGLSVEMGEIEAILKKHPMIRETAVVSDIANGNENRLVAYFVSESRNISATQEIRAFLRTKLPEYMVPTHFINLNEMPLTPSGKIDRKALPKPKFDREDLQTHFIAPRNEIEKRLAEIVAELLEIDKVGVMDNFFDLGGHSLLATQFMSRMKTTFQMEIPLRQIFESPTIAEMAVIIEQYGDAGERSADEKIEKMGRGDKDLNQLLEQMAGLSDEEAARMFKSDLQKMKMKEKRND
jgi:acyl carrier protein